MDAVLDVYCWAGRKEVCMFVFVAFNILQEGVADAA